jgi:hypothetical protein
VRRLLFLAQRLDGCNASGAVARDKAGEQGDGGEEGGDGKKRHRIGGLNAIDETREDATKRERPGHPSGHSDQSRSHSFDHDHPKDIADLGAECHANADFAHPSSDGVSQHAINPYGSKKDG